jgi:hypothetical protein
VFHHLKGKPCVRRAFVREAEFTPAEVENQSRFKLASKFANALLKNPVQQACYEQAAQDTGLSAQNVAVSDFMLAPTLAEIDVSGYTGRASEFIKVMADDGEIGAAEEKVAIADRAKAVVEEGPATVENDGVSWWYSAKLDLPPDQPIWITVTVADQPGNRIIRNLRHTTGA